MGNYRDLAVWKASQSLAVTTYRLTDQFPPAERFGLTSQMRRAAVSVMSNIAEGAGRGTDAQFANFLRIARGSLYELESQALLSIQLGVSDSQGLTELLDLGRQTGRLLHGLLKAIERSTGKPSVISRRTSVVGGTEPDNRRLTTDD